MAPLTGAAEAAVEGFFQSRRGQRVLLPAVAAKLVEYNVTKGVTLTELNVSRPADASKLDDWVEEWLDTAKAAGIADLLDVKNVGRWIREEDSSSLAGLRSGKAFAVADALARKGVVLDRAGELAITAALAAAEQGDTAAQCRHVDVIWHIYTGQSPGEDDRAAFLEKRAACMHGTEDATVDLRLFKSYSKQMSSTSVPTLERSLIDRTGAMWPAYYADKIAWLNANANGFAHAAMRFISIVAFADTISGGQWAKKRRYLQLYFFEYHLGRGMPETRCVEAALRVSSGDAAAAGPELKSTVPSGNPMGDLMDQFQQMQMMGRWQEMSQMPQFQMHQPLGSPPLPGGAGPFEPFGWKTPVPTMQSAYGALQQAHAQMPQGQWPQPLGGMQGGFSLPPALGYAGGGLEEVTPAEQTPCAFCQGNHVQSKCTKYIQARNAEAKRSAEVSATRRQTAEARKAEAAAASAAAAAAAAGATLGA